MFVKYLYILCLTFQNVVCSSISWIFWGKLLIIFYYTWLSNRISYVENKIYLSNLLNLIIIMKNKKYLNLPFSQNSRKVTVDVLKVQDSPYYFYYIIIFIWQFNEIYQIFSFECKNLISNNQLTKYKKFIHFMKKFF